MGNLSVKSANLKVGKSKSLDLVLFYCDWSRFYPFQFQEYCLKCVSKLKKVGSEGMR